MSSFSKKRWVFITAEQATSSDPQNVRAPTNSRFTIYAGTWRNTRIPPRVKVFIDSQCFRGIIL